MNLASGLRLKSSIFKFFAPRSRTPAIGHVDRFTDGVLSGWAFDSNTPYATQIDVFIDRKFLGRHSATSHRADAVLQNCRNGYCGFEIPILNSSDYTLDRFQVMLTSAEELVPQPKSSRVRMSSWFSSNSIYSEILASFNPGNFSRSKASFEGRIWGTLRAEHNGYKPGHGWNCAGAYSTYVRLTHGAQLSTKETGDNVSFLTWYIENYGAISRKRAVLSHEELTHLNETVLRLHRIPFSRAMILFIGRWVQQQLTDLSEADIQALALTWVNAETTRLCLGDELISDDLKSILIKTIPSSDTAAYPLSTYMSLQLPCNPNLNSYFRESESGRKTAYCLLLTSSICAPHTVHYMPTKWIRGLLNDCDNSFYESHLKQYFGDDRSAFYTKLRAYIDSVLDTTPVPTPAIPKSPACDLQIIGPYRRSLGLNRSLQVVTEALSGTSLSKRYVDYDLCNSSPNSCYSRTLSAPGPARINLFHLNLENLPDFVANSEPDFSNAYNIAMPYWELDSPAPVHQLGIALVDEIWVASSFLEQVFRKSHPNVFRVGMACELPSAVSRLEETDRSTVREYVLNSYGVRASSFTFLTALDALSTFTRKNLIGVISAFRTAFSGNDDVRLILKTRNIANPGVSREMTDYIVSACRSDRRIHHIDQSLSDLDHYALLAAADCHISLHRAEGFGFNLLESMLLKVPVISTNYSGTSDFCTDATSWLVDFDMTHVGPKEYPFSEFGHSWATPRTSSAAQCMLDVFSNERLRRERVNVAYENARTNFSLANLALTISSRLNAIRKVPS